MDSLPQSRSGAPSTLPAAPQLNSDPPAPSHPPALPWFNTSFHDSSPTDLQNKDRDDNNLPSSHDNNDELYQPYKSDINHEFDCNHNIDNTLEEAQLDEQSNLNVDGGSLSNDNDDTESVFSASCPGID